MATQRVIIAKIAGASASALFAQFSTSCAGGIGAPAQRSQEGSACPERHSNLRQLMNSVRSHAEAPPVVFYVEYIDMWSMGDVFREAFSACSKRHLVHIVADDLELMLYCLPDNGCLEQHIRSALQKNRKCATDAQETRWFLTLLQEALLSWRLVTEDTALLVMRIVSGPLMCDDQVERSFSEVADWCASPSEP